MQFCRGFSSGVGYVGTAEADIVLVPGHRVVTVKVLDMVMVMIIDQCLGQGQCLGHNHGHGHGVDGENNWRQQAM